mmetsp:Transcript_63260/g.137616  ORF Transcript_63260/g.137616 Transcript_63260/m.137616 type:complete len:124 (-) Transcript_63260:14-385(-)
MATPELAPSAVGMEQLGNEGMSNVKLFTHVQLYLMHQHEDIESLRKLHGYRNRHATRKADTLQDEMRKYEERQKNIAAQSVTAADKRKIQFQIDRMVKDMEGIRGGLSIVADAMGDMANTLDS